METRKHESRYQRRVLALGGLAVFALFVIGAPIYNNRIENDLERRVPEELATAGFVVTAADPGFTPQPITAKFSGQDGTLMCSAPLADPEGALDAAYDVWGVHSIELDRSCRVQRGQVDVKSSDAPGTETTPATASGATDTAVVATSVEATPAEPITLGDALAADPQFSSFALLVSESEIFDELNAPASGPVTVFAPTNDAFEDVPADMLATMRSDPVVRDRVLRNHMVNGNLATADLDAIELATGSFTALDGTEVDVTIVDEVIIVGGAAIVGEPFIASNGSLFSVDRVLVPEEVEVTVPPSTPSAVDVTFADGTITLNGVVATEAERQQLVAASGFGVGAENVVDVLAVDPATGVSADQVDQLNQLFIAMRINLVSGSTGFDGTNFYAAGAYAAEANRDAMLAAAAALGVEAELVQRPGADAESSAALETGLNEFVAANPILFEPSSAVLAASAEPILARIAATLLQVGGVATLAEGHTDSDGSTSTNLTLSQQRAAVVRDSLVARGVPDDLVTSSGFGSERPVLVDGVEDKAASRRVEFRLSVAP